MNANMFPQAIWNHPAEEIRRTREVLHRQFKALGAWKQNHDIGDENVNRRAELVFTVSKFAEVYVNVYGNDQIYPEGHDAGAVTRDDLSLLSVVGKRLRTGKGGD